jgi:2-methylcitrate dehydratase PrpD
MQANSIPVTAQLAKFISDLTWEDIPGHIQDLMPVLLIDIFRSASVGVEQSWTKTITQTFQSVQSHDTNSPIWFSDAMAEVSKASLINGTACGSLDWDDSHVAAIIHPGICIWPAALSVAYLQNSTGKELLTAVVAGYETAIRIGMSIQPEHSLRGFQGTPTCGAFGAAAACAKLLKLPEEKIQNALGIAATFACGLSQFFVSGSDIKRFHAGKAAANGVEAAQLAEAGLTGPHDAIEGTQGFARAFSDRFSAETAVRELGSYFPTESISLKPHASSVRMQAAIEAAAVLARQGATIDQMESIVIGVHGAMVGKLTTNTPRDFQQAQLSTPFAVAMAIKLAPLRSEPLSLAIKDYEDCFNQADVHALALKTTCVVDLEVEQETTMESVPARVTCTLTNGQVLEHFIKFPKGCPENPITLDEVALRFKSIATPAFGGEAVATWLESALHLSQLESVQPLFSLKLIK